MKTATLIRFTEEQLAELDALAARYDISLAALVRASVDFALPRLKEKLAVQYDSTIDPKLKP